MMYSEAFDRLPVEAKDSIYKRMWQVLSGKDKAAKYAKLSLDDRNAIVGILRETKRGLPRILCTDSTLAPQSQEKVVLSFRISNADQASPCHRFIYGVRHEFTSLIACEVLLGIAALKATSRNYVNALTVMQSSRMPDFFTKAALYSSFVYLCHISDTLASR